MEHLLFREIVTIYLSLIIIKYFMVDICNPRPFNNFIFKYPLILVIFQTDNLIMIQLNTFIHYPQKDIFIVFEMNYDVI
ncbi:hypothetical protein [Bifidobacterium commune]|uniref:hypothetical protein n=1 Tax=Bifidobacterium commune TaxID=1505727 RepID=UPI000B8273C9|nr:hypothetical protein [Bifidobacterium commune]